MPTKTFALEKGGPERLEIEWQGNFKDVEVRFDGVLLGSFDNAKALDAGGSYTLEDGSTLEVKRAVTAGFVPELTLTRNGKPLPGSAADPEQRVASAAGMIFFVAGLNALLGLVAVAFNVTFLQSMGLGLASILEGAIFGALGYFVRQRSIVALGVAVGLFVLDGVALLASASASGSPPIGGLVARCFLLVPMVMGFPALRALQAEEKRAQRAPRPRPAPRAAMPAGTVAATAARVTAAPPPTRTLSGDAERHRLELSRAQTATATRIQPSGRRIQTTTKTDVDSAESSLRFVARKCEVTPAGLKVSYPDGRTREVAYPQIVSLVVRLLPPDPPWNAQPLLDAVVRSSDNTSWETVRVFSTTLVNTAALPGGGSTSRLENVRRLGAHLLAQHPALNLDPETGAFVTEGKPPARFVSTSHFAEYDQRYS
jgi:hypothetical protein